jgi:signal transduction histidine kinase
MINGLYRLNLEKKIPIIYTEVNGMQNSNIEISSEAVLPDGRIAVGTFRDFMMFNPDAVIDTTKVPAVVLTSMKALDKPILVDSAQEKFISLPYDQSALTIEFTTLNFSKHYTVIYMMEGLDKQWRTTSDMKVSYPYLPSGDYIFKVQAVNEEGIVGETIELLEIHVQTAFWKSWWFWSIIGALILGFLYWLDRRRIKRREFIQQMRTNIAVNLHEEVNTALNKINLLSEIAGMKADYEIEKSKEYIQQIRTKSRHMIVAMNDLLWSIEPSNDDMRKTTERLTEYLDGLNNEVQGKFTLKVDNSVYQRKLDMHTRYHSLYLFKAVIENLFDFSVKNAELSLRIERNDLVYRVSVKDEYLNDYDVAGILKVNTIADRISQLNGTAHIDSHNGNHQLLFIIPLSEGKEG